VTDATGWELQTAAGGEVLHQAADVADRPAMVYDGANDGMLHAFHAATGTEHWAYIPSAVVPDPYKLADAS
jgi:Tfp pilus tip-associated adhesin PilY1